MSVPFLCSEWVTTSYFIFLSRILAGGSVSVRVRLKGGRIHDSLVVHQLVTFVIGKGEQLVVFRVSDNLVAFEAFGFRLRRSNA